VKGHFPKDCFHIDLDTQTVTCPAGNTAPIRVRTGGRYAGHATFGDACATCPLAAQCTTVAQGRTITIGHHEATLATARTRQTDPEWKADYRATRPKVERKIGHLMRRRHGGRRARVHGLVKVAADFALLAAAVNLARLGRLGIASTRSGSALARSRPRMPGHAREDPATLPSTGHTQSRPGLDASMDCNYLLVRVPKTPFDTSHLA
jgi:hypothetical protein